MFNTIFDIIQELMLTVVSTVFMGFSLALYLLDSIYKKNAISTKGTIVGIEKYVSRGTSSNSRRSSQLLYREIVSFIYDGNELFFIGSRGSSAISYKIGDKVKVEYIFNSPGSARIAGRVLLRNMSFILLIVGLVISGVSYTISNHSFNIQLFKIAMPFTILYFGYQLFAAKFKKHGGIDKFISENNSLKTKSELKDRDIFWSNHEIVREHNKVLRPFLFITPILFSASAGTFYHFSTSFFQRSYIQQNLNDKLYDINELRIFITYIMANSSLKKEFLILGICVFFMLAFTHSYIYTLRKTNE